MNVLLECNQNNAEHVYQNGHYVNGFATGVPLYTGDTLSARLCSIDSQKTDSNTIIVAEDIEASITFSYYDCDYDFRAMKAALDNTPWPVDTMGYYAGYGQIQLEQLNTCRVNFPAGYEGLINVHCWFSWVDVNGVTQTDSPAHRFGFSYAGVGVYDPAYGQLDTYADCAPFGPGATQYRNGTLELIKVVISDGQGNETGDPRYYDPANNAVAPIGAPTNNLLINKVSITIPAGKYDPLEISQIITQQIGAPQGVAQLPAGVNQIYSPANPCLLCLQEPQGQSLIWAPITEVAPTFDNSCYKYIPASGVYPYLFVGADLMAIQYGLNGPIFQWSYGYTPFYNAASPGTKNVVCYVTGNPGAGTLRYNLLTTATGITIHDLQPVSFWQELGLYDAMITPLLATAGGTQYYTFNNWNVPEEGSSLNFFTTGYNRNPVPPAQAQPTYYLSDSIPNVSILGNELTSNPTGGYFLVKARFNGATGEYLDNTALSTNIAAIVSTQYNSSNTITGFGDSGVPFTNLGAPFIISSATIDILDPLSKTTAPQLGANNTVVFEITRAARAISVLDVSGHSEVVPDNFQL